MTPEERLTRIEMKLDAFAERVDAFGVWVEKSIVAHEKTLHEYDGRLRKLEEMQVVLMESQNSTWLAIDKLTENIEKLVRGRGTNGHEG